MAVVYPALLSLMLMALTLTSYHHYSSHERASSSVSEQEGGDRNLTVYAMAVGQGDGNIILCPNGRDIVIVDMGSSHFYANKSYGGYLLKKFGALKNNTSIHVVITHPHKDHFNFLQHSIKGPTLGLVKEIVLGGKFTEYPHSRSYSKFKDWIIDNGRVLPVYMINNGSECFNNTDCKLTPVTPAAVEKDKKYTVAHSDRWQFCGSDVNITILGANICVLKSRSKNVCKSNKNVESVVIKIIYKRWSLFLSGDFEGINQQEELMKHWPHPMLQSTYYKVAHHGAWTTGQKANLPKLLKAINATRAYVSQAHPLVVPTYTHPKCEVIDNLINLASIEKIDSWNYVACFRNTTRKLYGQIEYKLGYAIYETCRYYDYSSRCQTCQDIEITTDGYGDYTVYRNVPDEFVNPDSKNCRKPYKY